MSKSERFVGFVWWFIWCASVATIFWAVPWTKVWMVQRPVIVALLAIGAFSGVGLVLLALVMLAIRQGRTGPTLQCANDPGNEPDRPQPS